MIQFIVDTSVPPESVLDPKEGCESRPNIGPLFWRADSDPGKHSVLVWGWTVLPVVHDEKEVTAVLGV